MKKITFEEARKVFRKYNKDNSVIYGMPSNVPTISAVIVYKQSNFTKPYTETERSYRITNTCGKAFFDMPSGSQSMTSALGSTPTAGILNIATWRNNNESV